MASAQDVQNLLRLLTTGRNKLLMMAAMGRVKALQAANLRSISDIASSDLPTLKTALDDEKAAKSLLTACKSQLKSSSSTTTPNKHPASESAEQLSSKRSKSAYDLPSAPQTPSDIEASLALPHPSVDEEAISNTTLYTNRAPLVLAFAVKLLEYTMPEQPLSSRLSLAQAVVSANSRSKAVSLGIEKGGENGWEVGQPRVRVMGREVPVLKRSGYVWKEEDDTEGNDTDIEQQKVTTQSEIHKQPESSSSILKPSSMPTTQPPPTWSPSAPITLKKSTFIAHCIALPSPTSTSATTALSSLLTSHPNLTIADHNIYAYRTQAPQSDYIFQSSDDDGENGGGAHLLKILQESKLVNAMLVVSRWYGGIFLGPDRWQIMSSVAREALAGLGRVKGTLEVGEQREPLWGLDLQGDGRGDGTVAGMPVHKPEGAKRYLLKSFRTVEKDGEPEGGKKKKKTPKEVEKEREENLGLLLRALGMLYESWMGYISAEELDRRAWGWYVRVRPDVEHGVAGWGGKGEVRLKEILELRREG